MIDGPAAMQAPRILVDADACPGLIKDILFRTAVRLSRRNFMEELRGTGFQTGGPAVFHARDRQAFGNQLDQWLAETEEHPIA